MSGGWGGVFKINYKSFLRNSVFYFCHSNKCLAKSDPSVQLTSKRTLWTVVLIGAGVAVRVLLLHRTQQRRALVDRPVERLCEGRKQQIES